MYVAAGKPLLRHVQTARRSMFGLHQRANAALLGNWSMTSAAVVHRFMAPLIRQKKADSKCVDVAERRTVTLFPLK